MRALTVVPGQAHSVRLEEVPPQRGGAALAPGICGTERPDDIRVAPDFAA